MTTQEPTSEPIAEPTAQGLAALGAAEAFMKLHSDFRKTTENSKAVVEYIATNDLDPLQVSSYERAWTATAPELEYQDPSTGETLKGDAALNRMSSEELKTRLRDPEFRRSLKRLELGL